MKLQKMKSLKMRSIKMKSTKPGVEKTMDATKRMSHFSLGTALVLGCLTLPGFAQNQTQNQAAQNPPSDPSQSSGSDLADYARKVRKEDAGKNKTKVFDNDNLPREDKLSIVGAPSPENTNTVSDAAAPESANEAKPAGEAKTPEGAVAAPPPVETKDAGKSPAEDEKAKQAAWKEWQDKLVAQKGQIDLLTRELDVLQREYQIRAAAFYGDVGNRLRNSGTWDKQDADYKQQLADKQKAVEDAKQKLDDLDEDARKAGVPSSMREP
jgi:hypothetical protein